MTLETRAKHRLLNDHAWPIGREQLEALIGDVLPQEPCALVFSMPTKGYTNRYFKENGLKAIANLYLMPMLRRNPYAFDSGATLLPCTLHLFAVPKTEVHAARQFIVDILHKEIRSTLETRSKCSTWYGADESWQTAYVNEQFP